MERSFASDAKSVLECSDKLELTLKDLREKILKKNLKQSDQLDYTIKLIEKLSILNEYKLNLFKDFSLYNLQKK